MRSTMLISFIILPFLPFVLIVAFTFFSADPLNSTHEQGQLTSCERLPRSANSLELQPCLLLLEAKTSGLSFTINSADFPADEEIRLSLHTPAGTLIRTAKTNGEFVTMSIDYVRAGLLPYSLSIGDESLSGQLQLQAGDPVSPLALNIGSRMLRVTSNNAAALVIHPLDHNKNVSDRPVSITAISPNQELWQQDLAIEHLLAWTYLPIPSTTGTLQVIAQAGEARGERGEVDVLAGSTASNQVETPVNTALASGRDTWDIQVLELRDALNNPIEDGTALNYVASDDEIDFFLTRPSIQGEQRLTLPSYPKAGEFSFVLQSGNYQSESWQLSNQAFQHPISIQWLSSEMFELGPVMDSFEALMDDGTSLELSVLNDAGERLVSWQEFLEDGRALIILPPLEADAKTLRILILGEVLELELPQE